MSETLESALALARELAEAFKTGAKTPVPSVAGKAGAEAVCVPPKFPAEKPDAPAGTKGRGRLPSTRGQTEANYAKQLSGTAILPAKKAGGKPELECSGALHISLFFDGTCCNQEDADDVYGSDRPPLTNIGRLYGAANWQKSGGSPEDDGYFCYYFPGCGARFPEIGEDNYTLDGELFANGGEDRINQALLKTFASIIYTATTIR